MDTCPPAIEPIALPPRTRIKVAFVSQPEYFRFTYEHDLDNFADVFEFRLTIGVPIEQFQPLIDFQADINFFFRGEFVPEKVLERLTGHKVALSSEPFPRTIDGRFDFTRDSISRYLAFRAIRSKAFDYVFHYDAASIPLFERDGLHISGEFPFPVATSVYRPTPNPARWDIFFIGRSTAHRESYFGVLKHHHHFLHICHGLWGPELVEYICSSKICLNVHAENETSWEPRMQMLLSCGVFVISERITPNTLLRPGVDYVEIGGPAQLHEAVEHYLHHPDERARFAQNAADRIRETLDSGRNFQTLIDAIRRGAYDRFRADRGDRLINNIDYGYRRWTQIKDLLR